MLIFIKDFMHIMEKVFYHEVCLNGHRSSKIAKVS